MKGGRRDPRPRPTVTVAITAAGLAILLAVAIVAEGATGASKQKPKSPTSSRSTSGRRYAPEITVDRWLNSAPIRPKDLKGKPRLVAFWTLGGENCRRTVPALREIQFLYAKRGLLILGVHTPETPGERDSTAVSAAAKELGLTFPIALDDDYEVWKAFKNRRWPALYLIDGQGTIRSSHIGELHVKTRAWANFTGSIEEVLPEKD